MTANMRANTELFPPTFPTTDFGAITTVDISELRPCDLRAGLVSANRSDPRDLHDLAVDIYTHTRFSDAGEVVEGGQVVPLLVRPVPGGYEYAFGQRRLDAIRLLQRGVSQQIGDEVRNLRVPEHYPVKVQIRELSDAQMLQLFVTENTNRKDLSEIEVADSYLALYRMSMSKSDIAMVTGKSFRTVERRLTLAEGLCARGRELLRSGVIGTTQAFLIASASGQLKESLLAAAHVMDVRDVQALLSVGNMHPEYALFDLTDSGIELETTLFSDLPQRFRDPQAALAKQIETLGEMAQAMRAEGRYAFVEVAPQEHVGLPEGYEDGGTGLLMTYDPRTGEVRKHEQVRRVALTSEVPAPDVEEALGASAPTRRSHAAVKPLAWEEVALSYEKAAAQALGRNAKLNLANFLVQMLCRSPLLRISSTSAKDHLKTCPEYAGFMASLVARAPHVFRQPEPGALRVTTGRLETLRELMSWELSDLLQLHGLLTMHLVGGAADPEECEYMAALAEYAGLPQDFTLTERFLDGFKTDALHLLVEQIPESLRPIVFPSASKHSIKSLLLERAGILRAAGWVPDLRRLQQDCAGN